MLKIVKHLLPLFIVQFFTWLALFTLWIYATPIVTKYFFHTTDSETILFENGIQWVGICFALYSVLGAFLAFSIPKLNKKYSKTTIHSIALFIGSIGLGSIYFIQNQYLLLISFVLIGISWSSISSIPYQIINDIAPSNKIRSYYGIFNFSTVIPQVVSAFLLSYLFKTFFKTEVKFMVLIGGISMFVASIIMFSIKNKYPINNNLIEE